MSAPERLAATTDAESGGAAQSKKLGAKAARAWRQLPDGGWQRRQPGGQPDPPRSRCAPRPGRLSPQSPRAPAARACLLGPGRRHAPDPILARPRALPCSRPLCRRGRAASRPCLCRACHGAGCLGALPSFGARCMKACKEYGARGGGGGNGGASPADVTRNAARLSPGPV